MEQQYKRNQEAVQLAKLASLAVRVESHLLRRLRLELLPDADVGVEADFWFGPLVESRGVRAIVLNRYVAELLRDKLTEDRQLLRRVISLTEQAHAESATTIKLEERLTALAVLNEPDAQQQIDQALRPALRTMQLGGEDARQLAHWAMRALSQAHRSVRESPNAIALGLSARLVLGGRPMLREAPKLMGDLGDLTWLLRGAISGPPMRIGVELVAGGVAFAEPGGEQPQLELPATNPLLLSLAWNTESGEATMLVEAAPGRTVELDADVTQVELRTLSGAEYLLSTAVVESSAETTSEDLGVRQFDIDVFISYAYVDNDQGGWVTVLHEMLRRFLSQRMGREVTIWMDPQLSATEVLADEVMHQLSKSAVMISILSPRYVNSDWCMNEVINFCRLAEQTGGVIVDKSSRVFKVTKTPIDIELATRLPHGVRNTPGYDFFEVDEDGRVKRFEPNSDLAAKIRAAIKMDRDDIAKAYIDELQQAQKFDKAFAKIAGTLANDVAKMLSRLSAGPRPQPPAQKIFRIYVSYGPVDGGRDVRRLIDKLVAHFGEDLSLIDAGKFKPSADIAKVIKNAVESCNIMIVIIGKRWFSKGLNKRIRLEIARALRRDIPIIPVLVQGARMPNPKDVPLELAELCDLNAFEISNTPWPTDRDIDELIRHLDGLAEDGKPVTPTEPTYR